MTDFLSHMNGPQRDSVTAVDGPVLVVAGAGSGKTRVLTTRIAWLMEQQQVRASEILAFTFTNRAAKEMRERVAEAAGAGQAPFWIGTFHATGLKILRADGSHIGIKSGFSIFDTDDSKRLLKQVMSELNIDPKQFTLNATRSVISKWKNDDVTPAKARAAAGSFIDEKYADLYEGYTAALVKCNALDFDDLILRTVHLLEQVDEVREKYARRFRHVLVDEFQDTNPLQLLLVKLLSSEHGNVFAVGDDDQSIYSWRGARIENMLNFDEYFPGAVTYRLEQNYRSTGNILEAANAVIAHNKQRKGKNLWTSCEAGELLTEEEFFDDEDEAARLVDIIRAEIEAGFSRGEVTVLYRTNAQSRVLEDALRRASIPYQIVGGLHFYDRKEVRDLMAYLKLVSNPADLIAAQRVINVPKRKIGGTTVGRLLSLAAARELTLGEAAAEPGLLETELAPAACRRVRDFFELTTRWRRRVSEGQSVLDLLTTIISDVGYQSHLEAEDPESAGSRNENIAELINAAASFEESSAGGSLDQFLEQVALVSDPDKIEEDEGVVRLMTIHTAKGLEFPVVVITGIEDDILPHINSTEDEAGLEEERRLFYVAITRAQKRVYLLHAARRRHFGSWQESLPSRFLKEVPDGLVERRHLDSQSEFQAPIAQSLFGNAGGGSMGGWTGGSVARSRRLGASPYPEKSTGNSTSRSVRPEEWGSRQKKQGSEWDQDIIQDGGQSHGSEQAAPYFTGQTVKHGIFGTGTVSRIEGSGDDMMVTVDFYDAGRKHINPRFVPLVPVS